VLYLVEGRFEIGTPAEVMTSQTLSALYRTQVDVIRVRDQIVVVGAAEACPHHIDDPAEQA
jgi:zinc/manganese transport system ATP-binding protein